MKKNSVFGLASVVVLVALIFFVYFIYENFKLF
ncbi:hypothetical protein AAX30_01120 [Arcobacter porcinus]|nr:hypothetical protein AAX30_01120 [Arcobacter porcinus]